ncbi:hypothetical protein D9M71_660380 [compost metagenome]
MAFLHRVCGLQFVTNGAFEVVLGPVPGIALIAQIALGDHQQMRLLLAVHPAHPAQQRRDIAEPGSGQVGAHLQLRVYPGVDPPNQLEHQTATDHHRAVGLFGREVAHLGIVGQVQGCQLFGGVKAQFTFGARQADSIPASLQHGMDKAFKDEAIGDQPHLASTPDPCQGQLLRGCAGDLILTDKAEG